MNTKTSFKIKENFTAVLLPNSNSNPNSIKIFLIFGKKANKNEKWKTKLMQNSGKWKTESGKENLLS